MIQEHRFVAAIGRIYEVGFAAGMLTFFEHQATKIHTNAVQLYTEDLKALRLSRLVEETLESAEIDCGLEQTIAEEWYTLFLLLGFFSGYNFIHEFLAALDWLAQAPAPPIEIPYFQCMLWNENSAKTRLKTDTEMYQQWLQQLGLAHMATEGRQHLEPYAQKGGFLHADILALLHAGDDWRMLSIDLSTFSIQHLSDLVDIQTIPSLRKHLAQEVAYFASKSAFSNLNMEVEARDFPFARELQAFFSAFKRSDKETTKLAQAASYASSFLTFLRQETTFLPSHPLHLHVLGYTDRGMSAMTISESEKTFLDACSFLYQEHSIKRDATSLLPYRQELLATMRQNAAYCFDQGLAFMESLNRLVQEGSGGEVVHTEVIHDFLGSNDLLLQKAHPLSFHLAPDIIDQLGGQECGEKLTLREAHEKLVYQMLSSESSPYVFLTGNPGIGKTYAVIEFLKRHLDDGFLFFYISPRTQVNQDVIKNFHTRLDEDTMVWNPSFFALTTNAPTMSNYRTQAVHYLGGTNEQFVKKGITFLPWEQVDEVTYEKKKSSAKADVRIDRATEDELQVTPQRRNGVLQTLCEAIHIVIEEKLSNTIIATVATQSLKKSGTHTTMKHLDRIFASIHDANEEADPEKMEALSGRIKYLFFMVDEVTGDESGAEFLAGIHQKLDFYHLLSPQSGFTTKVIVADASLVQRQIVEKHLGTTAVEPDKIYFHVTSSDDQAAPLSHERFDFWGYPAQLLNANSYPASALTIRYRVLLNVQAYAPEHFLDRRNLLEEQSDARLLEDILTLLRLSDHQCIVYVQDKRRLRRLIQKCEKKMSPLPFVNGEEYLEIHANLSEQQKNTIQKQQNQVKVIFMTSSASRGLSFPKTRTILVDVPHFSIEQNLMEIIQVIYRGRGFYRENGQIKSLDQEPKELVFYVFDGVSYFPEDEQIGEEDQGTQRATPENMSASAVPLNQQLRTLALQERQLHIMNILLILKASILTRIRGAGHIGLNTCMMIPVGGKSISAVGTSFSQRMQQVIRDLQQEYEKDYTKIHLKHVAEYLHHLLAQAEYTLLPTSKQKGNQEGFHSYLQERFTFSQRFLAAARQGFDGFFQLPPLELGYVMGSMLIVPSARDLQEHYLLDLGQALYKSDKKMINMMIAIANEPKHPLRTRVAIKDALLLAEVVASGDTEKMQTLDQLNRGVEYHYAVPIHIFLHYQKFRKYFAAISTEETEYPFRRILDKAIHTFFPVDLVLPIGGVYGEIPFVLFRSLNLKEVRNKIFQEGYIFTSREFSLLNIVLARTPETIKTDENQPR